MGTPVSDKKVSVTKNEYFPIRAELNLQKNISEMSFKCFEYFRKYFLSGGGGEGLSSLSFVHSPNDTQNSFVFFSPNFLKTTTIYEYIDISVLGSLAPVDLRCRTFSRLKTPLPFPILWSMPCNGLETKWNIKNTLCYKIFYHKISCFWTKNCTVIFCDIYEIKIICHY